MARRSIYTEAMLELQEEVRAFKADAEQAAAIPFMHEDIKPSVIRQRSDKMTQAERTDVRQRLGDEGTLKMLRGQR